MASQITGFDIGEKTLKMAHFSGGKLKKTVCVELPDNLISGGAILSESALTAYIADSAKKNGIPRKNAAFILPGAQIHTRVSTVPIMTESQLKYNLPFEFNDYLTQEKSKYRFDYEVLETIKNPDGKAVEQRLFSCAALIEDVERWTNIFDKAGFKLKVIVPEEYVYSKLCRGDAGMPAYEGAACAIIDLGQQNTRVHILHNGEYDTKRIIDIGIRDLDETVADETLTDVHIAHSYKMNNHDDILRSASCMSLYNRIAVEVMKAVNFYNYNNRDVDMKDIYMIGGGSAIEPLVESIRTLTGMNVHSAAEILPEIEAPWLFIPAVCCAANT